MGLLFFFFPLISLGNNLLSGTLPSSLSQLRHLRWLSIEASNITGTIPPEYGHLSAMETITLVWLERRRLFLFFFFLLSFSLTRSPPQFNNYISGTIPSEFGHLTRVNLLDLSNNLLSGTLPSSLSGMQSLIYLHLSFNNIGGSFPSFIPQLPSLNSLQLVSNNLTGRLPDYFRSAEAVQNELRSLQINMLNVSDNHWTKPYCWCSQTSCRSLSTDRCAVTSSSSSPQRVAIALIILLTFVVILVMAVAWARHWQRSRTTRYDTIPMKEIVEKKQLEELKDKDGRLLLSDDSV